MNSCVVAITGASGSIYGLRLIEELLKCVDTVHLCISHQSFFIIRTETGVDWAGETASDIEKNIRTHYAATNINYYDNSNMAAPVSSGSFHTDAMFVVPCSMKSLSGIASGYASNLIERAADVTLKERRKLVIAPREMPFNAIHLENMLKLSHAGAIIAPPVPAYYQQPRDIHDIVNFVVGKILDSAGINHNLFKRWE